MFTPCSTIKQKSLIIGLRTGASFSVLSMAAMHHFDSTQRGSANSTNAFLPSLGMTVGITVFGVIQRNLFMNKLKDAFANFGPMQGNMNFKDTRSILRPDTRSHIPKPILDKMTEALASSIAHTFYWCLVPACLALLFVLLMGKERLSDNKSFQNQAPNREEAHN